MVICEVAGESVRRARGQMTWLLLYWVDPGPWARLCMCASDLLNFSPSGITFVSPSHPTPATGLWSLPLLLLVLAPLSTLIWLPSYCFMERGFRAHQSEWLSSAVQRPPASFRLPSHLSEPPSQPLQAQALFSTVPTSQPPCPASCHTHSAGSFSGNLIVHCHV